MSDTKVQRYGLDSFDCIVSMDDGPLINYTDHARIVAEKDALLAKYQRLHAADVPRKQTVDDYGSGSDEQNMDLDDLMHMRGWNDCVDAMLATHPQDPTK